MDVVRSNLKKLNGSNEVDTKPGQGTSIHLSLPVTLAILPVLLAQVGEEIYALPLRSISGTSRFVAANVHRFEEEEVICFRDETLPLLRLQKLVACPGREIADADKKVVVIAAGDLRIVLLVDSLIGQESTVVKPLLGSGKQCPGITGATIGGDGRVRLVLDPAGLLLSAKDFNLVIRLKNSRRGVNHIPDLEQSGRGRLPRAGGALRKWRGGGHCGSSSLARRFRN